MTRNLGDIISKMTYGDLIKVPSTDSGMFLPKKRGKELMKYFSSFFHENYGICWSFDLGNAGLNPVKPGVLYFSFEVLFFPFLKNKT